MRNLVFAFVLGAAFLVRAADNVAPSVNPPGGLTVAQCPMFIAFGFDDNGYPDGINWAADFIKTKKNPAGNGNPATFDGATVHASFFITTGFCTDSLMAGDGTHFKTTDVLTAWKRLYTDGNDVGDHTHIRMRTNCSGVPRAQIIGFRTPFLMFAKESMQSELDHSMLYDCSIEHYKDLLSQEYVWPYTMDKGQAPSAYIRDPTFTSAPGLWEMPVYEIMTDTNWQAVTGLDYNMWVSKSMAKDQFEYCLKITLDNRLKNNRAPFLIGMHSDYYSQWNDVANGAAKETWQNRRASVQDFITYALALNKDIRVVSFKDVLTWVRHPVALGSAVPLAVRENEFQRRGLRARLCGRFVRLTMPQSGICHPALYDCNGRRILDFGEQHLSSGENMLQLKQGLVPGLYTLRIDNGTNSLAVENGLQK